MLPANYEERVYAGVLGKIIGVYLGRPFEGWTNDRIEERLGEIDYYVHDKLNVPLVVTDDDISGTFTFVRAVEDYGANPQLTPKQIGQTWLNYLIDRRTVLWWGGLGNSTEHTAYIRLQQGVDAPQSGSMAMNGQVVAEQIGAQIFIDGWAMLWPGQPDMAADFARRAASVSHDGEAVHGAQVLAGMESLAFVEEDIDKLIEGGLEQVPADCLITRMIGDIREWHGQNGDDWRKTFRSIQENYGYDKYGGNCHIIPNHGLIIMSLLHGDGDFSKSLMIVNTAGWDTDCNSGNLGCLMGIRNGLEGIDAGPDWRTPFGDVCYLPTADSGGGISDAAIQTRKIVSSAERLHGVSNPPPKGGARYHFSYPGSVQGFRGSNCRVSNKVSLDGEHALAIHFDALSDEQNATAVTGVFTESKETAQYFEGRGYGLMASPALNSGQVVKCEVQTQPALPGSLDVAICIKVFNPEDNLVTLRGPMVSLDAGDKQTLEWTVPDVDGYPISAVGIEVRNATESGTIYLNWLDWSGPPTLNLTMRRGQMWRRAWVNGVDSWWSYGREPFRLIHNTGTGLLLYGARQWTDYSVAADVTPHLAKRVGLAVRVQGMRRYYGLVMTNDNQLQLVKELDGTHVLAACEFSQELYQTHDFSLAVSGNQLRGEVDGDVVLQAADDDLAEGGVALLIDEGRTSTHMLRIRPIKD